MDISEFRISTIMTGFRFYKIWNNSKLETIFIDHNNLSFLKFSSKLNFKKFNYSATP
ncbi:Uncharacterised protein [Vibrio paracholerae]|nr:Uncharacterised protein [Vibrio paracholerae]